jgi:hypothetical protein
MLERSRETRRNRAWKWIVIVMALVYVGFSLWFMLDMRARLRRLEHPDENIKASLPEAGARPLFSV